jgi:hypothetical protein
MHRPERGNCVRLVEMVDMLIDRQHLVHLVISHLLAEKLEPGFTCGGEPELTIWGHDMIRR